MLFLSLRNLPWLFYLHETMVLGLNEAPVEVIRVHTRVVFLRQHQQQQQQQQQQPQQQEANLFSELLHLAFGEAGEERGDGYYKQMSSRAARNPRVTKHKKCNVIMFCFILKVLLVCLLVLKKHGKPLTKH